MFFFSSRRRHTRYIGDWSSDVCSSDLAQGRHIATNAAKSMGTRQTAEAAGDLLLHFEHAQIALGQVVVKVRSEERRVGKECRSRWQAHASKKTSCLGHWMLFLSAEWHH